MFCPKKLSKVNRAKKFMHCHGHCDEKLQRHSFVQAESVSMVKKNACKQKIVHCSSFSRYLVKASLHCPLVVQWLYRLLFSSWIHCWLHHQLLTHWSSLVSGKWLKWAIVGIENRLVLVHYHHSEPVLLAFVDHIVPFGLWGPWLLVLPWWDCAAIRQIGQFL